MCPYSQNPKENKSPVTSLPTYAFVLYFWPHAGCGKILPENQICIKIFYLVLQNNLLIHYKETISYQTQSPELHYFLPFWSEKYNYPPCQHLKDEEALIDRDSIWRLLHSYLPTLIKVLSGITKKSLLSVTVNNTDWNKAEQQSTFQKNAYQTANKINIINCKFNMYTYF